MHTLEFLRKDAKHWLRGVRNANPGHVKRLRLAHPGAPARPGLRDIQHALARELGYGSWRELKAAAESRAAGASDAAGADPASLVESPEERIARFLQLACWDHETHGRGMYAMRTAAAMRLLEKHPEIARGSLHTAVVCADVAEVERILAAQPALALTKGGARGWEPLLYLCYARLPLERLGTDAVSVARLLLAHGADPNAYYMAGDALYGTLVGVAGDGEQDAPPHVDRERLYRLMLEAGAEPFDMQVLYNTHFRGEVLWWLSPTYEYTTTHGLGSTWSDPAWPMLDMGGYGCGARFLLWLAIEKDDVALAAWLLEHGADPNAPPPRAPSLPQRSLREHATDSGSVAIAQLLRQHGAHAAPDPGDERAFVGACLRLDHDAARAAVEAHPEYRRSPAALFAAARRNRPDVIELVLSLGVPVNVQDGSGQCALHVAAASDARQAAAALLAHGADANLREQNFNATPLGFASHHHHVAMMKLLTPVSRDVFNLAQNGEAARLRDVIAEIGSLSDLIDDNGYTPLWWLPADDARALEVVELLLGAGVDPTRVGGNGTTAQSMAHRRGLDGAAARLGAAAAEWRARSGAS